ncbi:MAG TPA: winged helix-turn-helix domain-containing protein [Burkholderiales bacterium]|jgi:molybdate transport system regulatory protein|nr:winged helix-turn-helix domain-containing protein [Burkholderiales bacterium]
MSRGRSAAPASRAALKPQIRIMFRRAIAMGPGKADLLEAIADTGSISAAARKLGMSYRRAWLLVDTMNRCFERPLVQTATGGSRGGGARVTELGQDVIRRYRAMDRKATAAVARELAEFAALMSKPPSRQSSRS